jgi:hypothetical protein
MKDFDERDIWVDPPEGLNFRVGPVEVVATGLGVATLALGLVLIGIMIGKWFA